MSIEYEWGPWIEHDGRGFPNDFLYKIMEVTAETHLGSIESQIGLYTERHDFQHWDWSNFGKLSKAHGWRWARVIRYRVCRPRVTEWLEQVTSDLPAEVDA